MRLIHRCRRGRSTVTGKARFSAACYRLDMIGSGIEPPHDMILHFHPIEITRRMISHFVGFIKLRLLRITTVSLVSLFSAADDGIDEALLSRNTTNRVIHRVTKNNVSVQPHHHTKRIVEECFARLASIAGIARTSGTGDGGYDWFRATLVGHEKEQDKNRDKSYSWDRHSGDDRGSFHVSSRRKRAIAYRGIAKRSRHGSPWSPLSA